MLAIVLLDMNTGEYILYLTGVIILYRPSILCHRCTVTFGGVRLIRALWEWSLMKTLNEREI